MLEKFSLGSYLLLVGQSRLLGSYFETSRERLKEIATFRGEHHVDNAIGLTG